MTAVLTSTFIALLVIVLLVIVLLVNTRRPAHVSIRHTGGDLVVETPDVRETMHTLRPALGPLDWVPSGT